MHFVLALLLPLIGGDPHPIEIIDDIPYIAGGGHLQQLDLFLPSHGQFPTIVFVHGGSLMSGDRKGYLDIEPLRKIGAHFATHGIGCAMISYRLGPQSQWPTMAQDVASAFAWVKHHIHEHGGSDRSVFLGGHSSGAHLTAVVGSDSTRLGAAGCTLKDIAGCIVISSSLHPSYDIDGLDEGEIETIWQSAREHGGYESIFPTAEDYRDADPLYHVNAGMPRFLIIFADGETQRTPALQHADLFTGRMARLGRRSSIEVIENRDHMSILRNMADDDDPTFLLVVDFIKRNS